MKPYEYSINVYIFSILIVTPLSNELLKFRKTTRATLIIIFRKDFTGERARKVCEPFFRTWANLGVRKISESVVKVKISMEQKNRKIK